MAKYVCRYCGIKAPDKFCQCVSCGLWNTMRVSKAKRRAEAVEMVDAAPDGQLQRVYNIKVSQKSRLTTGIATLDKAFGGSKPGMMLGSCVMLSGSPGVGKSTLLTQLGDRFAEQGPVVYACGEEVAERVKERADRLQLLKTKVSQSNFYALTGNCWETLRDQIEECDATAFIIDSVNVFTSRDVVGAPGGVLQMSALGKEIATYCQQSMRLGILVCQITKSGIAAGPKAVEHQVDTVAHMARLDKKSGLVAVKFSKNRFGSTDQEPILKMTATGLKPSSLSLPADEGTATVNYQPEG